MLSKYSILLFLLILFTGSSFSQESFDEKCTNLVSSEAVAFWDFNRKSDKLFPLENGIIKFHNRHSGVLPIPDTDMFGIRFHFKGKWPDGDSSSEWRYTITEPQNHIFEYMQIYQPKNFYHRMVIEIQLESPINPDDWNYGDKVVSDNGHYAKVAKAFTNRLYILAPDIIYRKAWGEGRRIKSISTNIEVASLGSKSMGFNNKLSAMWQGKYSNAAMIVGTTSEAFGSGGKEGSGYCETLISKSLDHATKGTQRNMLGFASKPLCFDTLNNGSKVEFVIERKRSTNLEDPDGVYTIWRRTEDQPWEKVYYNNKISAYQTEKNYFDRGYIFGWSNSGFKEDTDFYLLSWGVWNKKPSFL